VPAIDTLRTHLAELTAATGVTGEVHEQEQPGMQLYLVLHHVPLPAGVFAVNSSTVLFITDKQYPLSAMDMFWTDVEVVRADGGAPQNAAGIETYLDRPWRCFSWHRNSIWNPDGNPLLDHYAFMETRLQLEPEQVAA